MIKSNAKFSSSFKEKRRKRLVITTIIFIFDVFILILASGLFSHSSFLKIDKISIGGDTNDFSEEIKAVIQKDMEKDYLGIWRKATTFIYPKKKIQSDILDSFPKISDVKIYIQGLHDMVVEVSMRESVALWCGFEKECYFLDKEGIIFSKTMETFDKNFVIYEGDSGVSVSSPIKSKFNLGQDFSLVKIFIDEIKKIGFDVKKVSHNSETSESVFVLREDGKIILRDESDFSKLIYILDSIKNDKSVDLLNNLSRLDYIDLRFGNKVAFKLR